ncbi:MAG: caspase family protein [Lewinellaceae bacterium]|nr:caspase family protein [Lewinellaceae bacterium]
MKWITPGQPSGFSSPMLSPMRDFPVELIIESAGPINSGDLKVVQNIFKKPASKASQLLKTSAGKYKFSEVIQLDDRFEVNKIIVRISKGGKIYESPPLFVKFLAGKPNLYLLSIGVQTKNLNYTVNDAVDFANLFKAQGESGKNRLFNLVEAVTLTGLDATAAEIIAVLDGFVKKGRTLGSQDLVIVFIASHGFLDINKQFRIQGSNYDPDNPVLTSVALEEEILEQLQEIGSRTLLFIDACQSGGARSDVSDLNKQLEELNRERERLTIITSSREDQVSWEDVRWRNGAFTEAIVRGVQTGAADANGNGIITVKELYNYVRQSVFDMVFQIKKERQNPRMIGNEPENLELFIVK